MVLAGRSICFNSGWPEMRYFEGSKLLDAERVDVAKADDVTLPVDSSIEQIE